MAKDRDANATSVLLDVFPDQLGGEPVDARWPAGRWLLAGPIDEPLVHAVAQAGGEPARWRRLAIGGPASAEPPAGPFQAAVLRLPRAREALDLAVNQLAGVLAPGAPLFVLGNNDEGIKAANKRMSPLFDDVRTLDARKHARVWVGQRGTGEPAASIEAWAARREVRLPGGPQQLVSYPGCFAKGGLDAGTALLLAALPKVLPPGGKVFDLACGIGVIGAAIHALDPTVTVDGSDADALAVRAAAENAPYARLVVGDGPGALAPPEGGWDLIVSNPPFHEGFDDATGLVRRWIAALPPLLARRGRALIVVQRHRPVLPALQEAFGGAQIAAETPSYRVYACP